MRSALPRWFFLLSITQVTAVHYVLEPFETKPSVGSILSADAYAGKFSLEAFGLATREGQGVPHVGCQGDLSLWAKAVAKESTVQLILEGREEAFKGSIENVTASDWRELRWERQDFANEQGESLDDKGIYSWSINVEGGTVLVDQLVCHGANAFEPIFDFEDWEDVLKRGIWYKDVYESPRSDSETHVEFVNGTLSMDYLLEQAAEWGGYYSIGYFAPQNAYLNLSGIEAIALPYSVAERAVPPERPNFRIVLAEVEDSFGSDDQERFYSFSELLSQTGDGVVERALQGDEDPESPFYLTKWTGGYHDGFLNKEYIKGLSLELNINHAGDLNSTVTGSVNFGPLRVSTNPQGPETDQCVGDTCSCVDGVVVVSTAHMERIFYENDCCGRCQRDPDCHYAVSAAKGRDCLIASELRHYHFRLARTPEEIEEQQVFVKTVDTGNWCDLCVCDEGLGKIDCVNKNLATLPSVFDEDWNVRTLDLRRNDRIALIGPNSFDVFAADLEQLFLPRKVKHLPKQSVESLLKLENVFIEDEDVMDRTFCVDEKGAFDDVCCNPESSSVGDLSFCRMSLAAFGDDTVYLPFVEYNDRLFALEITPNSRIMSEASESVEKCAEYCTIDSECTRFTYDQRLSNAVQSCVLINEATGEEVRHCCSESDYADSKKTVPGFISGKPPRTRHFEDNARVFITRSSTHADVASNFTAKYSLYLRARPQRGAVWVEPVLLSDTHLNISFTPSRAVFYNTSEPVEVVVSITGMVKGEQSSLVITNKVTTCDDAFSTSHDEKQPLNVVISVSAELGSEHNWVMIGILAGAGVVLLVVSTNLALIYYSHRKNLMEQLWKVDMEDLAFPDPEIVLGRGTFGMVLLAEYKGTQVAVKRVLPPEPTQKSSRGKPSNVSSFETPEHTSSESKYMTNETITTQSQSFHGQSEHERSQVGHTSCAGTATTLTLLPQRNQGSKETNKLLSQFVEEMRQLSMLRHPCITTVMGAVVTVRDNPMLVMEYMENGSLYDLLHNDTVFLDGEIILPMLRDIARGMRFLHASTPQIVHRDLKAANILVDGNFRAKVADFGLSQKKNLGAVGTPYWMAPELLRGESTNTPESDAYAFGMILFEMYAREDPYVGEEFQQVIAQIKDPGINKRPHLPPDCPDKIKSLMTECLVSDPSERPTFEELDLQLKRANACMVAPRQRTQPDPENMKAMLLGVIPQDVADAICDGRKVEPIYRDTVTVFCAKIVGFPEMYSYLPPVSDIQDRLFSQLDALAAQLDIFKVQTIGDSYVAVTNLVKDQNSDHVKRIAKFSVAAVAAAKKTLVDVDDPSCGTVDIRVGFHCGSVVAKIVGSGLPRFSLFGDTVNTASYMESTSLSNTIQCTLTAATLMKEQCPQVPLHSRGTINVKSKGKMQTYFVNAWSVLSVLDIDDVSTEEVANSVSTPETEPSTLSLIRSLIPKRPSSVPRKSNLTWSSTGSSMDP